MTTLTKTCTKCGKSLPATTEYFNRASKSKSGLYCHCRECRAKFRQDNAERIREQKKADYQRHRERYYAYERSERGKQRRKKYYDNNREYFIKRAITYQQNNPEAERRNQANYYKNNRVKRDAHSRSYHARKMNAPGKHTGDDILALHEKQGGKCYWCSKSIQVNYDIDHIIPLVKGGTNWPNNLCVACPACNRSKNDKLPYIEWTPPNPLIKPDHN